MKKILLILTIFTVVSVADLAFCANRNLGECISSNEANALQKTQASVTFRNKSDYKMTLKVIYSYGGLYSTVVLNPKSDRVLYFSRSGTFKLKIKAEHYGSVSYHDGGSFSVTCTDMEWTEGEMSFSLSIYGNGLGPTISEKEFESNY